MRLPFGMMVRRIDPADWTSRPGHVWMLRGPLLGHEPRPRQSLVLRKLGPGGRCLGVVSDTLSYCGLARLRMQDGPTEFGVVVAGPPDLDQAVPTEAILHEAGVAHAEFRSDSGRLLPGGSHVVRCDLVDADPVFGFVHFEAGRLTIHVLGADRLQGRSLWPSLVRLATLDGIELSGDELPSRRVTVKESWARRLGQRSYEGMHGPGQLRLGVAA